jgi:hypothetical protein
MPKYLDRKNLVRAKLFECITSKPGQIEYPYHDDFGPRVGIPTQGPWRPVLDSIADEEDAAGRPDITFVVRSKKTGYPSRIGRVTNRNPSIAQKARAREKMQEVIDQYNPGSHNPY